MKIVIEDLLQVASNLEHRIDKLNGIIERINTVIYNFSNMYNDRDEYINELMKNRDDLFVLRDKFLRIAEVIYVSLNYYIKWDEANASYCYEDKIIYPNKDKGVVDLTEIKNILEEFKNIEWRTTW